MDQALIEIAKENPFAAALVFIGMMAFIYFMVRLGLVAMGVISKKDF